MNQLELFSPFESNEAQTFELPDGNLIFYPAAFPTAEPLFLTN